MILIGFLLLILLVLGLFIGGVLSVVGSAAIIVFGDVIVCMALIALLIRHIIKKRK